jgi:hypothetical protein
MATTALADELAYTPELFPIGLSLAPARVRLIRLSEAQYAQASFLDERLLSPGDAEIWAERAEIAAAATRLPLGADFIFHIGHVGSTLLARLLGLSPGVFALREPAPLRTLAAQPGAAPAWLDPLLRLYARTWRRQQRGLIKATSFVSEIAPRMLEADPSARAILMAVRAPVYLPQILGGEATRAELPRLTPDRLARLGLRLGASAIPPARSPGEMAAAAWACEMCALAACAEQFAERVLWLDFDRFLIDPRAQLASCLVHLGGEADADLLVDMLASPDMYRYSKAPEFAFSAGQRGQILRQAGQEHAVDIARGLAWLEALARAHAPVAAALAAADKAASGG